MYTQLKLAKIGRLAQTLLVVLCLLPLQSNAVIEVIGIRERSQEDIQAFFDAVQHEINAAGLAAMESQLQVLPTEVAEAEPDAQCSKTSTNTRSSTTDRRLGANQAARDYMSARLSTDRSLRPDSFQGRNLRVVYADGSSEVWTITTPGSSSFIIGSDPVSGTQLPPSDSASQACRAVGE
jgi:hypothetical protein